MIDPSEKHSFNARSRVDRAIHEMLGVVRGILFDGKVSDDEARALDVWLRQNNEALAVWPAYVIAERIQRIFYDGRVDEEERAELKDLLERTIGEKPGMSPAMTKATRLPISDPLPALSFTGRVYVFTGKFAYGTRKVCEEAVIKRGAKCSGSITEKTGFLVIGEIGSADWKHSAWGRKIETAAGMRRDGAPIHIIPEEHWVSALKA